MRKSPTEWRGLIYKETSKIQAFFSNMASLQSSPDVLIVGAGVHSLLLIRQLCKTPHHPQNPYSCLIIESSNTHSPHFESGFWLNSPSFSPSADANFFGDFWPFQPRDFSPYSTIPSGYFWASLCLNYVFLKHPIYYQTHLKSLRHTPSGLWSVRVGQNQTEYEITPRFIVIATGLGQPQALSKDSLDNIWDAHDFLKQASQGSLPVSPHKKVLVVGGGDTGASVIERLIGASPYNLYGQEDFHPVQNVVWLVGQKKPVFRDFIFHPLNPYFPVPAWRDRFKKIQKVPQYFQNVRKTPRGLLVSWGNLQTYFDVIINATGFVRSGLEKWDLPRPYALKFVWYRGVRCAQVVHSQQKNLPLFFVGCATNCSLPSYTRVSASLTKNPVSFENLKVSTESFAEYLKNYSDDSF